MPQFGPALWNVAFLATQNQSPGRTAEPNAQYLNLGFTMLEAPRGLQANKRPAGPLDVDLNGRWQQ